MLQVKDDGIGLPEGLDIRRTQTMGLGMVQALTEQLDGTMEVERGSGTAIRIGFSTEPADG
jgi:hypothetical protein